MQIFQMVLLSQFEFMNEKVTAKMQPKGQIFQQLFSREQLSLLFLGLLLTKKGTWKFDTQLFFHHKF
jgi:hypothetical protein